MKFFMLFLIFCSGKGGKMVRKPAVAGYFYPASSVELKNVLDEFFAESKKVEYKGKAVAGIAPHAGYSYSGKIASLTFKNLSPEIETFIIIGPKHGVYSDKIFVYPSGEWETPLGKVDIDENIAEEIVKYSDGVVIKDPRAHEDEHSVEVEVPFIQRRFKKIKIVPIVIRTWNYDELEKLGDALAKVMKKHENLAVIVSTDLYHGYSYEECLSQDKKFIKYVNDLDSKGLYQAMKEGSTMACGGGGVVALLHALKKIGNIKPLFLGYTNSNEVTGKKEGYVVGYVSFVFVQEKNEESLNKEEKRSLIEIARKSIKMGFQRKRYIPPEPESKRLREFRGAFVTIKKRNTLRGCIGYIEGIKPLYLAVADVAFAAAFNDPRFPPLTPDEFADIELEITVLSPLKRINQPEEVIVGKHGLLIKKGVYQGVLLPQVPVEEGWDRETFLAHTCLKAGLPPDSWKDPSIEMYVFTGEVFSEKEIK